MELSYVLFLPRLQQVIASDPKAYVVFSGLSLVSVSLLLGALSVSLTFTRNSSIDPTTFRQPVAEADHTPSRALFPSPALLGVCASLRRLSDPAVGRHWRCRTRNILYRSGYAQCPSVVDLMSEQPCSNIEFAQRDRNSSGNDWTVVVHLTQLCLPSEGPLADTGLHCFGRNVDVADDGDFGPRCCDRGQQTLPAFWVSNLAVCFYSSRH